MLLQVLNLKEPPFLATCQKKNFFWGEWILNFLYFSVWDTLLWYTETNLHDANFCIKPVIDNRVQILDINVSYIVFIKLDMVFTLKMPLHHSRLLRHRSMFIACGVYVFLTKWIPFAECYGGSKHCLTPVRWMTPLLNPIWPSCGGLTISYVLPNPTTYSSWRRHDSVTAMYYVCFINVKFTL